MNSNTKCTVIGARIEEHSLERRGGEEEHSRSFYKNNTKMCKEVSQYSLASHRLNLA